MQQSLRLIDVTRLIFRLLKGKRPTGVDHVSLAYIAHYRHEALAVLSWSQQVIVLGEEQSGKVFARLVTESTLQTSYFYWLRLLARLAFATVDRRFKGHFLFNTGHKGLESHGYARTLKKMGVRPIYFVHDLIPLTHPEYCRPDEQLKHAQRMTRILNDAHGLVVNSQYTNDKMYLWAKSVQMDCPPTEVAWLASKFHSSCESNLQLYSDGQKPYFVILSTIEPRKNHLLLHVWRKMLEVYGRDRVPRLVLVGQRGWECEQVIDLLERCEALRGFVVEKNQCSDEELHALLSGACAVLFPSFVEGFGMPLVEALSSDVPVIASDIAVFREIGQGVPEFVDENDGPAWMRLIMAYSENNSLVRASQLERMRGYRPWLWEDHFRVVDSFLERLEHES